MSVVDMFKPYGDRNKPTPKADMWYNNRSVYAKNFIQPTYKNVVNDFSKLMADDEIKSVKMIGDYAVADFPRESNNRCQYFYNVDGKKVNYSEICKLEEIQASKYSSDATNHYKKLGYDTFINIYKKSELNKNVEIKLCTLAFKK